VKLLRTSGVLCWVGMACSTTPHTPSVTPGGGDIDADTDADTDSDTDADVDTDTRPTADTGDFTTTVGPDWANCSLDPTNALRVVCAISDEARTGTATWTVTQGDRIRTATAATSEEVVLWGLAPNLQLYWTVEHDGDVGTGAFPTGTLPAGVASIDVTVEGTPLEVEAFAIPYTCDGQSGAAVIDTQGDIIWYRQEPTTGTGVLAGPVGIDWVDDRLLLALGGRDLLETDVTGRDETRVLGTERPLHHDVALGEDYRYVLNADQHGITVVDGFYVFDVDGNLVGEWDLADHVVVGDTGAGAFWMMEFPFAVDWSHANSIELDGPDHVLLSLKHLNTILRVVANPDRPDFGTVEWFLDGGRSSLASDFTWTDAGIFRDQHHVSRLADGSLGLFDNTSQKTSRAMVLDIDEGNRTVAEGTSWPFPFRCAIQGSLYEQPGGNVLGMCSTSGLVHEFTPDGSEPEWEAEVLCLQRSAGSGHLARAIPVDLPE